MQPPPLRAAPDRPARPVACAGAGGKGQQQRGFARLQLADLVAQRGQVFKKRLVGHPGPFPCAASLPAES